MSSAESMSDSVTVELTVNGRRERRTVPARTTLADLLRDELGLTGTHVGCEHGVCGACTVLVDGASARACLTLAAQADGTSVTTVEGLSGRRELNDLQQSFREHHALQAHEVRCERTARRRDGRLCGGTFLVGEPLERPRPTSIG